MEPLQIADATFEDVKREFTAFLAANGKDEPLLWVFEEDTLSRLSKFHRTDFWLKLPLPPDNEASARRHFEFGKAKGFGIGLSAFGSCEAGLICSFIVPTDAEDAQFLFANPTTLRFALPIDPLPEVKIIRSRFLWKFLKLLPWFKKGSHIGYLRSKTDL